MSRFGGGNETARVHQSGWRRGSVVDRSARAAARRARAAHCVLSGPAADDQDNNARLAAFRQRLQQLGWTDGHNVRIDYRFAAANLENYRKYAAELVALAPDVILAPGTSLPYMLEATRMVSIVFPFAADPVGAGLVESLARHGGNATGFISFEYDLSAKWLELLKEIAPSLTLKNITIDFSPVRADSSRDRNASSKRPGLHINL
jgi:putative tryptophan/tyrosine transport system substrate-binding protein